MIYALPSMTRCMTFMNPPNRHRSNKCLLYRANRTIEDAITSHSTMVSEAYRNWYMCQVVLGSVLMSAVEIVLMARVYALYKKSIWIASLFIVLILAEMVTVVIGIVTNVPGKDFRVANILLKSPTSYVYYGISAIVSQITILGFTLAKYKTAVQGGWGKVPIMILMVRDGTAAFFILLVVTTMTVVATSMETEYAPIGNSLILNMQKLSTRTEVTSATFPPTILLTTLWNGFEHDITQVDEGLPITHRDRSCGVS
ncbi:hypothetical protein CVT25_006313 [Psilocybe cyanescens]|uniref:Uncharacterized protein n=1 Tax=Psilocybe cyanescens TaxID=93625 RepID=A0A409WYM6_PSICY|nr:hypothetical protein CVT25_006313 [Psilocybe cyanescens]